MPSRLTKGLTTADLNIRNNGISASAATTNNSGKKKDATNHGKRRLTRSRPVVCRIPQPPDAAEGSGSMHRHSLYPPTQQQQQPPQSRPSSANGSDAHQGGMQVGEETSECMEASAAATAAQKPAESGGNDGQFSQSVSANISSGRMNNDNNNNNNNEDKEAKSNWNEAHQLAERVGSVHHDMCFPESPLHHLLHQYGRGRRAGRWEPQDLLACGDAQHMTATNAPDSFGASPLMASLPPFSAVTAEARRRLGANDGSSAGSLKDGEEQNGLAEEPYCGDCGADDDDDREQSEKALWVLLSYFSEESNSCCSFAFGLLDLMLLFKTTPQPKLASFKTSTTGTAAAAGAAPIPPTAVAAAVSLSSASTNASLVNAASFPDRFSPTSAPGRKGTAAAPGNPVPGRFAGGTVAAAVGAQQRGAHPHSHNNNNNKNNNCITHTQVVEKGRSCPCGCIKDGRVVNATDYRFHYHYYSMHHPEGLSVSRAGDECHSNSGHGKHHGTSNRNGGVDSSSHHHQQQQQQQQPSGTASAVRHVSTDYNNTPLISVPFLALQILADFIYSVCVSEGHRKWLAKQWSNGGSNSSGKGPRGGSSSKSNVTSGRDNTDNAKAANVNDNTTATGSDGAGISNSTRRQPPASFPLSLTAYEQQYSARQRQAVIAACVLLAWKMADIDASVLLFGPRTGKSSGGSGGHNERDSHNKNTNNNNNTTGRNVSTGNSSTTHVNHTRSEDHKGRHHHPPAADAPCSFFDVFRDVLRLPTGEVAAAEVMIVERLRGRCHCLPPLAECSFELLRRYYEQEALTPAFYTHELREAVAAAAAEAAATAEAEDEDEEKKRAEGEAQTAAQRLLRSKNSTTSNSRSGASAQYVARRRQIADDFHSAAERLMVLLSDFVLLPSLLLDVAAAQEIIAEREQGKNSKNTSSYGNNDDTNRNNNHSSSRHRGGLHSSRAGAREAAPPMPPTATLTANGDQSSDVSSSNLCYAGQKVNEAQYQLLQYMECFYLPSSCCSSPSSFSISSSSSCFLLSVPSALSFGNAAQPKAAAEVTASRAATAAAAAAAAKSQRQPPPYMTVLRQACCFAVLSGAVPTAWAAHQIRLFSSSGSLPASAAPNGSSDARPPKTESSSTSSSHNPQPRREKQAEEDEEAWLSAAVETLKAALQSGREAVNFLENFEAE